MRLAAICVLAAGLVWGQSETKKPAPRVTGQVTAVDASTGKLTVRPDNGGSATVHAGEQTRVLRVPEGEKDPQKFIKIAFSDIAEGDRIVARGAMDADGTTLIAAMIYDMSKADVAQKQQQDRSEWQKLGVAGQVVGVDPSSKQITISVRGREGLKPLILDTSEKTVYHRYAPDSVKSTDAKPGSFDELKTGDEVRALGEKSADGTHLTAQQIFSGAFQTLAATVVSVDAASNTIHVTQLPGKQAVTVRTTADTILRRLPAEMAAIIAQRRQAAATDPAGAAPAGSGGNGHFDLQQMLERLPASSLDQLKPGDALIVSSSKGNDPTAVTAMRVIAGVEPFLAAAPRSRSGEMNLGEWSMDMSVPGQ